MANKHCRLTSWAALRKKTYSGFASEIENQPKEVMLRLFSARKKKLWALSKAMYVGMHF